MTFIQKLLRLIEVIVTTIFRAILGVILHLYQVYGDGIVFILLVWALITIGINPWISGPIALIYVWLSLKAKLEKAKIAMTSSTQRLTQTSRKVTEPNDNQD